MLINCLYTLQFEHCTHFSTGTVIHRLTC